MLKSAITFVFIVYFILIGRAQSVDCPAAEKVQFNKVMSTAFAQEYSACPVITEVEYFSAGSPKGSKIPAKIKNDVLFMALQPGSEGGKHPMTGEAVGETLAVKKEQSDLVFNLKKGDRLRLTGTTYVHDYFGHKTVYFIISKMEKL